MKLTCCPEAGGLCPTYGVVLSGRVWEVLHGVRCTEAQYQSASKSLLSKNATPTTKVKLVRKNSGCKPCGKKLKPL